MLAALDAFDPSSSSIQSTPAANATQSESGKNDAIVTKLREKSVTVQKPRDALFGAIHALLLEAGTGGLCSEANAREDAEFVDKFITSGESTAPVSAAGLLQNLKALREKFTPFAESIRPAKKKEAVPVVSSPGFVRPPDRDDRGYGVPSPAFIPPVGGGDAFPPSFGGGNPDMLVGPDHPLFGHRGDPSVGPVPGARFDPFGPSIGPLGPSGIRPPPRGPAPTMPFGGPGPDHMRMPRDDDMDPGFGFGGRGSRGGGGFSQPFGSDNAFF
ncbi:hypothetical protein ON010_g12004 [Phytophthora cinnamomi]|nr:hypothetical protein ON010_g12004 [Phytophthora cinnamomi]